MTPGLDAHGSPPPDPIEAPFHIQTAFPTKWSQPRPTMPPVNIVIHCTAATNPASSTAAFFASSTPSGSTQAVADDDQGFTMVPDDAVCAGAPPLNQEGLHIEQPGLDTWTRDQWLSHDNQLRRVAYHVAGWCKAYSIPVKLLSADDLIAGGERTPGITSHQAVSDAFHQSTHQDPGPNYPFDVLLGYVNDYLTPKGAFMALTDQEQAIIYATTYWAQRGANNQPAPPSPYKVDGIDVTDQARNGWNQGQVQRKAAGLPTITKW